ncbi:MAG: dihydrofolate reductase, partial [Candidatus Electrothrix sp. AR3]|nr:dihydrofolate reductase [Candidatus Electrothrix sp. AR3]
VFGGLGCITLHSLRQGIAIAKERTGKVFIIGGAQLYQQTLEQATALILTRLELEVAGDAYFPKFSCPPFELLDTEKITGPVPYRIETYLRKVKG